MIELEKLHTTPRGEQRIARNLDNRDGNIMDTCRNLITDSRAIITSKGKNIYVTTGNIRLTINHNSHTIITAHIIK